MTATIIERPIRRDPKSGLIEIQPAFEGWRPKEPKTRSSWWLVLGAALLVFVAIRSGL